MSYRWLMLLAVLAFVAVGVGCEQAEQAAKDAEAAVDATAEKAGDAAEGLSSELEKATADLLQRAEKAAQNLDGEAKALYDNVSGQLKEKQDELMALKEKISGMSPQDLLEGEGKSMKENADKLTSEIGELKTKLEELIAKATS